MELDRAATRFAASGWRIEYDADVPDWLAATGYDAAFGARHLQRNIELRFLPLLAAAPTREVRVVVGSDRLVVAPSEGAQR